MSAWNQLDLDNELNRNDETRNDEVIGDRKFPAVTHKYDRREHAHHSNFAEKKLFEKILAKSNQSEISMEISENLKMFSYKNLVAWN